MRQMDTGREEGDTRERRDTLGRKLRLTFINVLIPLSGGQVGGPCPLGDSWILDSETGVWESFATCVTPAVRASMIMVSILLAKF